MPARAPHSLDADLPVAQSLSPASDLPGAQSVSPVSDLPPVPEPQDPVEAAKHPQTQQRPQLRKSSRTTKSAEQEKHLQLIGEAQGQNRQFIGKTYFGPKSHLLVYLTENSKP